MFHLFVMLGTAFVIIQSMLLLCWCLYLGKRNVSMIDVAWGLGFVIAVFVYFALGEGFLWRKILVGTIVSIWGIRLSLYLAYRFNFAHDDPRYEHLLETWPLPSLPSLQVLFLYLVQGCLIIVLSLPFALMAQNSLPVFCANEIFGLLIWMIGLGGETIADWQLAHFKARNGENGEVLDQGLWKYSRHPNYFFEWIIWVGYFCMAISSPWGWISVISPIVMLYLLFKVSGVSITEAHLLTTKGENYRNYQAKTSTFFPWFNWPTKKSLHREVVNEEVKTKENIQEKIQEKINDNGDDSLS